MELEERLQKLSKQHSEHRWTLPFLVWRCFYAVVSWDKQVRSLHTAIVTYYCIPGAVKSHM